MPRLTLAQHSSGKMKSIRDVANGLACDCVCSCGERLIARQGDVKDWSFAHESGAECAGALETALHKSAIQIITDEKKLYIGEYDPVNSSPKRLFQYQLEHLYKQHKEANPRSRLSETEYFSNKEIALKLFNAKQQCSKSRITFSETSSNKKAEGSDRRPDVIGVYKGHKIYVEIVVTHACDEQKILELRALGVPTIQIHISRLLQKELTIDTVRAALTSPNHAVKREWLVKPRYIQEADQIAREYFDLAEVKLQELEVKESEILAEKRARRKIIVIDQVELHIDQRETWGSIWFSQRVYRPSEVIDFVFKELNAKRTDYYWTIQTSNILGEIQNIQEKIAAQENIRQKQEIAAKKKREEDARKNFEENRRQREEEERLKKAADKLQEIKLAVEDAVEAKAYAEQEGIRKAKEAEIIAEVEEKYKQIRHYKFRIQKIKDELSTLGIRYR